MTSFVSHTTVDAHDAYELSEWWKRLLGYVDREGDPNEPGHPECMIQTPEGDHHVLFIEVPDAKSVKNRLHFDLRPSAGTRDQEVERLLGIGAREIVRIAPVNRATGWRHYPGAKGTPPRWPPSGAVKASRLRRAVDAYYERN